MEKELNPNCPCTANCPRHGNCDACQENHKGGLTTCQRLAKEAEEA